MGGKIERYVVPILVGLAPVLFALVTWPVGEMTPLRTFVLLTALPVTGVEVFVIAVAFREGLRAAIRDHPLPGLAIAAIAVWLVLGFATSLLVAPMEAQAVRWTIQWVIHLLFGFSMAFLGSRSVRLGDLVATYLVGFVLYALIYVTFVIGHWGTPIDWVHTIPGAIHVRHVAIFAAAITGMSFGVLAGARTGVVRGCAFAVATIGLAIGFWTGARGMVVCVAATIALAAFMLPAMRNPRVLSAAALSFVLAFAAVAWLPTPDAEMMGVARQVSATTEQEMTTGRVEIWTKVVKAIVRNPVVGYGPGQMPAVARHSTMGQPHNLILQIVLDWGLIGLICVAIVVVYYLRRAISVVRRESASLAAPTMAMLSLLLLSMLDAAMFHVLPLSIFAACAGMIASRWWPRQAARPA